MTTVYTDFISDFYPSSDDDWRALVKKGLGGKDFDKVMTSKTLDGIDIHGLYTATTAHIEPQENIRTGPWDINVPHWDNDVFAANSAIIDDLENGATSLSLRFKNGAYDGLDVDQIAQILSGIYLDMVPIGLSPGEEFETVSEAYLGYAQAAGYEGDKISGCLGIDPIGTLAFSGRLKADIPTALKTAAQIADKTALSFPNISTFVADGSIYHGAGATVAMEIAYTISTALTYLRAMEAVGMTLENAAKQIQISIALDADIYMNIAKCRAVRRVWHRVLEVCGVRNHIFQLNAITGTRMFSTADPWVNILRQTAACFAGSIGGADSLCLLPHDVLLGYPARSSRRIARNVQTILQEESYLSRVIDPAAGSYAFETITFELANKSWNLLKNMELTGGIISCLENGSVQKACSDVWAAEALNIATRRTSLTGVSEFPNIDEDPIDVLKPMLSLVTPESKACATVLPLTQQRAAAEFETLRAKSDDYLVKTGHRPAVQLITLGSASAHTARATFAKNLFESGGIKALPLRQVSDTADMLNTPKGMTIAVLCGSDGDYHHSGLKLVQSLKKQGFKTILVAGRPANIDDLQKAGVEGFIYVGCNVLAVLRACMDTLIDQGDAS